MLAGWTENGYLPVLIGIMVANVFGVEQQTSRRLRALESRAPSNWGGFRSSYKLALSAPAAGWSSAVFA